MGNSFKIFSVALQITFWVVLFSIVLYVSAANTADLPKAMERIVLVFGCHLATFYACYSLIIPRYFESGRYTATTVLLLLLLIALTPLRILIERHFADTHVFAVDLRRKNGVGLGLIVFSEIAVGAFACLVRLSANSLKNKQRMEEMRSMQLESELRFLKSQMSPHFLFNTINNIYSLVLVKSDKAPGLLLKLSGLLRYLLYECDKQVTYGQEENALRVYSDLFRLRYDAPLNLQVQSEVMQKDKLLEPMLMIPILENAFKYSGLGISDGAFVAFIAKEADGILVVTCKNSIDKDHLKDQPGGIGLRNIEKRLELNYPGAYVLDIRQSDGNFIVKLTIPLT